MGQRSEELLELFAGSGVQMLFLIEAFKWATNLGAEAGAKAMSAKTSP
jgi:hypothetical protein